MKIEKLHMNTFINGWPQNLLSIFAIPIWYWDKMLQGNSKLTTFVFQNFDYFGKWKKKIEIRVKYM